MLWAWHKTLKSGSDMEKVRAAADAVFSSTRK